MKANRSVKQINRRRKLYWGINAFLKYFLKINIFRSSRLWVYGCWEGNLYDDNSRYLFEYVSANYPEIKSVWLSPRQEIVSYIRNLGFCAERSNSWEGIKTQLKAGVFFFTNGVEDIGNISLIHGAKIIGLWHGTGMKNVYFKMAHQNKGLRYRLKLSKDKIFNIAFQDYTIATSDMVAQMRAETYRIDRSKILITGQPRNDVFKKKIYKTDVLRLLSDAEEYRYIIYMPTYRPYHSDVIENFVMELSKKVKFVEMLKRNKIRFLLKLHYLTNIDKISVSDPFIILSNSDISSVQELLAISDYMVTDYSGCCIDFALQEKAILLYAPDFKQYCQKQGIKQEWYDIYKSFSSIKVDEFVDKMEAILERGDDTLALDRIINQMYENQDIKGTCYCENVYREVSKRVFRK